MNVARRPLRVLAVAGKETVEILRRPSALVSVVAGPVLILGLFGLGYLGQPPLRAELVIPPGSGLSDQPAAYTDLASDRVDIVGVTPDVATAREQLRTGAADIVVIAPADAQAELSQGRQAVMTVEYDTVSPYRAFIARTAADQLVAAVNSEVIATAAQRLADKAGEAGQSLPPELNPEVVAAPTRAEVTDLSPSAPNIVAFYGIMVLALIVQHTAITVSALSMLHDRRRGMFDLFRMSPIASGDLLTGKYAAFAMLGTVVALAVLAVLVFGFGVPFLAGPAVVVGAVALLVLASIGIGIVVALVSDSDRQAVQVALLVLLASVFFSGLALDLDQFSAPVRAVSALLPVTQAGSLLQDLMLRGRDDPGVARDRAGRDGGGPVRGRVARPPAPAPPAGMSGQQGPPARSPRRCEIVVGRGRKGASRLHRDLAHADLRLQRRGDRGDRRRGRPLPGGAQARDRPRREARRAADPVRLGRAVARVRAAAHVVVERGLGPPVPRSARPGPARRAGSRPDRRGRSARPATAASTRSAGCRPTTARAGWPSTPRARARRSSWSRATSRSCTGSTP